MEINVGKEWAVLTKDDTLRQNSKTPYHVEFAFDEDWDGFAKTAVFEAGQASVIVALTDDTCSVPTECLKHASVKLKVGVYGVKGEDRKGPFWCTTSTIIPDSTIGAGSTSGRPPVPDDVYSEIMAAIGDLSAAGFEGKTLAEIFKEIKDSACGTATDEEVDTVLDNAFGQKPNLPETPGEGEGPDNTATDEEVDDILNEVFGKQP